MGSDPQKPGYRYINISAPELGEEPVKVGCGEIVAATGGIGRALAVRGLIIGAVLVGLYILLRLIGVGNGSGLNQLPHQRELVLRAGVGGV